MSDLICESFEITRDVDINGVPQSFTLRDAICLTQGQWDALNPGDINVMHEERWTNWIAVITAPPIEEPEV